MSFPMMSTISATHAIRWLMEIIRAPMLKNIDIPIPWAVPGHDGSVQFEWDNNDYHLEICFEPDGTIEYLFEKHISTYMPIAYGGHFDMHDEFGAVFLATMYENEETDR